MSSAGEADASVPTVEKPAEEVKAMEAQPKPVKEKKPKAPKEKKPKQPKAASHPPYFQMIKEALMALNDKNGSSSYAIAKYMEEKHKSVLPANFKKILALQLKNQVARGKLIKIKASYKLSESGKKQREATTKVTTRSATEKKQQSKRKATETTGAAAKAKPSKKSESTKKVAKKVGVKKTKKTTPAKPKQPKSLRSPAKRARRATVNAPA